VDSPDEDQENQEENQQEVDSHDEELESSVVQIVMDLSRIEY